MIPVIRYQSGSESSPFDDMFGDAPPVTLKNPRDDKKNFGRPRMFHPHRSKAITQLMRSFRRREPESGLPPDIVKVPVIQAMECWQNERVACKAQ